MNRAFFTGGVPTEEDKKHKVFCTDHLSPATGHLFYKSKEALLTTKGGSYLYVWTSHGRILAKKTATTDPIEILSKAHLKQVADSQ